MAKSIHLICRRENGTLKGLTTVDKSAQLYRSIAWEILPSEADELVGGWVYFHPRKADKSEFGGEVVNIERLATISAHGHPEIGIVLKAKTQGRGQDWRGADHQMAHRSGLVDPDLPHEV
jgi:hypothetical protein